jgi:hypothetical protein
MNLNVSAYTVSGNFDLRHARILYDFIEGQITGDGDHPELADNDFTFQRWRFDSYPAEWVIETDASADVDTLVLAGHNLATVGATVAVATSADTTGGFTTRATSTPQDDSAMAFLFNTAGGAPHAVRRVRVTVSGGQGEAAVGIIRAGVALQMQRPIYGGHSPLKFTDEVEFRNSYSETGQWLGRFELRRAYSTQFNWTNLGDSWIREKFEPFRQRSVQRPFAVIENPLRMPEGVAWCWTNIQPRPVNNGTRNLMDVTLSANGLWP